MTTYQQILIILDNFEINFIGALFPPETAVVVAGIALTVNSFSLLDPVLNM